MTSSPGVSLFVVARMEWLGADLAGRLETNEMQQQCPALCFRDASLFMISEDNTFRD